MMGENDRGIFPEKFKKKIPGKFPAGLF